MAGKDEEEEVENWYEDYENIKWFGSILVEANYIDNKTELQYYYEKPWKWDKEWAAWQALDSPNSDEKNWDTFIDKLNEI